MPTLKDKLTAVLDVDLHHLRTNTRPGVTSVDNIAKHFSVSPAEALHLLNQARAMQAGTLTEPCSCCQGTGRVKV